MRHHQGQILDALQRRASDAVLVHLRRSCGLPSTTRTNNVNTIPAMAHRSSVFGDQAAGSTFAHVRRPDHKCASHHCSLLFVPSKGSKRIASRSSSSNHPHLRPNTTELISPSVHRTGPRGRQQPFLSKSPGMNSQNFHIELRRLLRLWTNVKIALHPASARCRQYQADVKRDHHVYLLCGDELPPLS